LSLVADFEPDKEEKRGEVKARLRRHD
jgi:hypothetical protein